MSTPRPMQQTTTRRYKKSSYKPYRRFNDSGQLLKSIYGTTLCQTKITGGPPAMKVPFIYSSNIAFTTGGVVQSYSFRLNSLFDPDLSGVGAQPPYYDQWTPNLYNNYRVIGASYTVEALIQGTAAPCLLCVLPSPDPGSPTTVGAYRGNPKGKSTVFSDQFRAKIKDYVKIDKVLGISRDRLLSDDLLQSAYSTNPSFGCYLHVGAQATDSSTACNVQVVVTIKYYAILSKKEQQEMS